MKVPVRRACGVWAALWIGLFLSVATSPPALAQSTLIPEAKAALQEGIAAAKFQNWDAAQKYFDDALAAAPGAPEVLFNLGLLNDRKGGAELVASAWYRAYLAAVPDAQNRSQVEARLIDLHASAEATAAKYMATAKEAAKQSIITASVVTSNPDSSINCDGGFRTLLRSEVQSGHMESVEEIIQWFQGHECQNDMLYYVVATLFALQQPAVALSSTKKTPKWTRVATLFALQWDAETSRYIERLSGLWKDSALALYADVKWREGGDKTSAVKLERIHGWCR